MRLDALYPVLGCDLRSKLATSLGAAQTPCRLPDSGPASADHGPRHLCHREVVSDLHQIAVATGHARRCGDASASYSAAEPESLNSATTSRGLEEKRLE